MSDSRLEVRDLTAGYGSQTIVFDVSAQFHAGAVTAIIGPNGAGKSTLLKAIFGLAKMFSGEIRLDGKPIARTDARLLVKRGIAYVPQSGNVFPSLTVRENLEIGTYVRKGGDIERVLSIFKDLRQAIDRRAGKLSGGQRSMLAVARALMSDPVVLLLDEATAGLSPLASDVLWEHLRMLANEGIAIAAVEQNVHRALQSSDDVYLLTSGRNRLNCPAAEFAARRDWQELFLSASGDNK